MRTPNIVTTFKIQILGDAGIGKSALLLRYGNHYFAEKYIPTVGFNFKLHAMKLGQTTIKSAPL